MKLGFLFLALPLLSAACVPNEVPDSAEEISDIGPPKGFQKAGDFDPDDVRSMRQSRDAWVTAFASGDTAALDFVFEKDAVIDLPAEVRAMPAGELFTRYSAAMKFNESSEEFMTDGGDPRVMTRLPWVSYYGDYELTLFPKTGGKPIGASGRFMTRFHREADGSLQVIRGPGVGDTAPPFALKEMKSGKEIRLADLTGEKPVVLVFGSYT